jgi:hypothetical protein
MCILQEIRKNGEAIYGQKRNQPVFARGLCLWAIDGIVGLAFLASVLNNEKTLMRDFQFFEKSEEQL